MQPSSQPIRLVPMRPFSYGHSPAPCISELVLLALCPRTKLLSTSCSLLCSCYNTYLHLYSSIADIITGSTPINLDSIIGTIRSCFSPSSFASFKTFSVTAMVLFTNSTSLIKFVHLIRIAQYLEEINDIADVLWVFNHREV